MRAALTDKSCFEYVQKNRDESNEAVKFDRNIVASTTAVSAGLYIGFVTRFGSQWRTHEQFVSFSTSIAISGLTACAWQHR
jgi:hypothetical protein